VNCTKGERTIWCAEDYWMVEVKDSSPVCIIGKFHTKEDALLDAAAPELYEALKELSEITHDLGLGDGNPDPLIEASNKKARKALAKAEGAK